MSQTKKTWDGLRTCVSDWDPKHPQLMVRGRADRQSVFDSRPEPTPSYITLTTFHGPFCLESPSGRTYIVKMGVEDEVLVVGGYLDNVAEYQDIHGWRFTVDDDGALHVSWVGGSDITWLLPSMDGQVYDITIDDEAAVIPVVVSPG